MANKKPNNDRESTRGNLLGAALAEFGDNGFAGARVDVIATSAGASKQALYHHFENKEGIFAAVVEEAYRRLRALDKDLEARLTGLEPEVALRELMEELYKPSLFTVRFQRIMHDENRYKAAHARGLKSAKIAYTGLLATIAAILDRGRKMGVFRTDVDSKELYIFLSGILVYRLTNAHTLSCMVGLSLDTEAGARRSRREGIDFVLQAMRPRRARID